MKKSFAAKEDERPRNLLTLRKLEGEISLAKSELRKAQDALRKSNEKLSKATKETML